MPWVTQSEFAKEAHITPYMVTKLKKMGIFEGHTKKNGKRILIDLKPSLESYKDGIDPNYAKDTEQIKNQDDGGNGDGKKKSSFNDWRTISEQYKAAKFKLEYDLLSGKYLEKMSVEGTLFEIARQLRDDIRNIPARCAALCAAKSKKKEKEIFHILSAEIDKGLFRATKSLAKVGK
jgi:hypothetical protein